MSSLRPHPPPGRRWLPLIGETPAFLRDSYGFATERIEQFGPVFTTSLLGRTRVVMAGPEACALWIDDSVITRGDSMPGPVLDVFGGHSLPLLDGDAHRLRKYLVTRLFRPEQLVGYLPQIEEVIDRFLSGAAAQPGAIEGVDALRRLALEALCKTIMGLDPGPEVDALVAEYQIVFAAPNGIPLDIPGTSLRRAIAARDRIFEEFDRLIAERRAEPTEDGLSTLLDAEGRGGERIDDGGARLELHHLVLAGYIVFGLLVGALIQLEANPSVRKRLRTEIQREIQPGPLALDTLHALPYLDQVIREIKRHTPVVNVFFGIAARDFELGGYRIPKGRSVLLSVNDCNRSSDIWTEPQRFDPERFGPERAEHQRHEHAFVPQGPGPVEGSHACAGIEFTTVIMSVFLTELLRGYDWSFPEQDLSYDWSRIPAEPKDRLRLHLVRL